MPYYIKSETLGKFVGEFLGMGFYEAHIKSGDCDPEELPTPFYTDEEAKTYMKGWVHGIPEDHSIVFEGALHRKRTKTIEVPRPAFLGSPTPKYLTRKRGFLLKGRPQMVQVQENMFPVKLTTSEAKTAHGVLAMEICRLQDYLLEPAVDTHNKMMAIEAKIDELSTIATKLE